MNERRVDVPMDPRSAHFVTTDRTVLEASAAAMPRSADTPAPVQALLARARNRFTLGGADYDNFASAFLTCLQAIEVLLRHTLGTDAPEGATMGKFISLANSKGVLTDRENEYLREFALHFRNKFSHPREPIVITPGLSEHAVTGCHAFIADFVARRASRQWPASE